MSGMTEGRKGQIRPKASESARLDPDGLTNRDPPPVVMKNALAVRPAFQADAVDSELGVQGALDVERLGGTCEDGHDASLDY